MFSKSLTSTLAAATIGLGALMATATLASADDIRAKVGYYNGHGHIEFRYGDRPRVIKRKHRQHAICHPGKAVWKAERQGVRHARVQRVNHRVVVVKGRKHGSKIKVAFHRDSPRCAVAWVKGEPRHGGHRRGYRY